MPYIVYFSYTIIIIHTKRKGYLLAEILWYIDPNEIIILYRKIYISANLLHNQAYGKLNYISPQ